MLSELWGMEMQDLNYIIKPTIKHQLLDRQVSENYSQSISPENAASIIKRNVFRLIRSKAAELDLLRGTLAGIWYRFSSFLKTSLWWFLAKEKQNRNAYNVDDERKSYRILLLLPNRSRLSQKQAFAQLRFVSAEWCSRVCRFMHARRARNAMTCK